MATILNGDEHKSPRTTRSKAPPRGEGLMSTAKCADIWRLAPPVPAQGTEPSNIADALGTVVYANDDLSEPHAAVGPCHRSDRAG